MTEPKENLQEESCIDKLTRKEFLERLFKKAAVGGAILSAPVILDKFLVPPAYAMASTAPGQDTGGPPGS